MKKLLFILFLFLPTLANAQTSRNPCYTTGAQSTQGILNCIGVGTFTSSGGFGPLPVGGLATAAAPSFVEGMEGGLSFDLNGNLRISGSFTPPALQNVNVTQWATTVLGLPTAYGTAPTVGNYIGVNAFVTNFPATQPISGTVIANQGTSPWVSNISQINGITPLMGNGTTGTGSQRVTIASDNTPFSVNATLSAETTKVIGTVNQGTSPWVVSGTVTGSAGLGITPSDRTITSASGSSQQIMAANASRHSLTIENTGNANCGINPTGGTAAIGGAGTITLAPLGSYTPRVPTLSAVTVICTAAQPIYGDEN